MTNVLVKKFTYFCVIAIIKPAMPSFNVITVYIYVRM